MFGEWTPLLWLIATLLPLFLTKSWINRHIQGLGLLLFGDSKVAMIVYFLLLLPGIIVHEVSHWLVATLLGVKTGKISLGPASKPRGQMRFGSVSVAKADPLRDSLIGLAPLIGGSIAILLIAGLAFGIEPLSRLPLSQVPAKILAYARAPDAWLWLYLIFAISNAMLPSEADRRPWPSLLIFVALVVALSYFIGWVPRLPEGMKPLILHGVDRLSYAFGLTLLVDAIFMAIIYVLEGIAGGIAGKRVEY